MMIACGEETDQTAEQSTDSEVEIQAATPEVIENGNYTEYYDNGTLKVEGVMMSGMRVGLWKSYHPSGQQASESQYANGEKEGKTVNWYENGMIRYIGYYSHDEASAIWMFYTEDGTLDKELNYTKI